MEIEGDLDAAKKYWKDEEKQSEDDAMDIEQPESEKNAQKPESEPSQEELLKVFPQKVKMQVTVPLKDKEAKVVTVIFSYLPKANLITVTDNLDNMLKTLFPNDLGEKTPNIRVLV